MEIRMKAGDNSIIMEYLQPPAGNRQKNLDPNVQGPLYCLFHPAVAGIIFKCLVDCRMAYMQLPRKGPFGYPIQANNRPKTGFRAETHTPEEIVNALIFTRCFHWKPVVEGALPVEIASIKQSEILDGNLMLSCFFNPETEISPRFAETTNYLINVIRPHSGFSQRQREVLRLDLPFLQVLSQWMHELILTE